MDYTEFTICREGGRVPQKANVNAVGWDVFLPEDIEISYGLKKIPLGIIIKPPKGYYFQLCLRSGVPDKYNIFMPHGSGIIDPDFCGPEDELTLQIVHMSFSNYASHSPSDDNYEYIHREFIPKGSRLCQLTLYKIELCEWKEISLVKISRRRSRRSFGSTGR